MNSNKSIDANAELAFKAIHEQMMDIVKKGTLEAFAEAGGIALQLLTYPELPLLFRVRAHIVLSYGQHDYLWHAQKAVELVDEGTKSLGSGDTAGEQDALKLLKLETQFALDQAEADNKALTAKLAEWEARDQLVLEPGMVAPTGYKAKKRKYKGDRPNLDDYQLTPSAQEDGGAQGENTSTKGQHDAASVITTIGETYQSVQNVSEKAEGSRSTTKAHVTTEESTVHQSRTPVNEAHTSSVKRDVNGSHPVISGDYGVAERSLPIINGAHDLSVKESGVKENGVKENGVKENGVKKNGVKESGVKENGVKEDGFKEDGFKENGVKENGI